MIDIAPIVVLKYLDNINPVPRGYQFIPSHFAIPLAVTPLAVVKYPPT